MNILIPWDELSREQRGKVSTDIWFSVFYENVMKYCTTPLRTPDEWTADECIEWTETNGRPKAAFKALEIATRPPKPSAVDEMDAFYGTDAIVTYDEGKRIWQAVKAEKNL